MASIQLQGSSAVELQERQGNSEHQTLTDQVQHEMLQRANEQIDQTTVDQQRQALQHHLQQFHGQEITTEQDGEEINIQQQPQILITQNPGRGEGKVTSTPLNTCNHPPPWGLRLVQCHLHIPPLRPGFNPGLVCGLRLVDLNLLTPRFFSLYSPFFLPPQKSTFTP